MGCGNSKNAAHRAEAEAYNRRKKAGFNDPGLEKHRKDCVNQKKKLRHVENPDMKRKQKEVNIKAKQKKEAKGPGGLTQAEVKAARKNLKHRR
jgi:hypothetical protein